MHRELYTLKGVNIYIINYFRERDALEYQEYLGGQLLAGEKHL